MVALTTADRAAAMGRRAGEAFRDLGTVTACPFPDTPTTRPLRDAWTRAYVAAAYGRGTA